MPVSKPAAPADWATTASGGDITPPSGGQQATGWTTGQFPPHNWFNWWMNLVGTWTDYVNDLASQAWTWTGTHIFQTATRFASDVEVDGTFSFALITAPNGVYAKGPTTPSPTAGHNLFSGENLSYWQGLDGNLHISGAISSFAGFTSGTPQTVWAAGSIPAMWRPAPGSSVYRICYAVNGVTAGLYGFAIVAHDGSLSFQAGNGLSVTSMWCEITLNPATLT